MFRAVSDARSLADDVFTTLMAARPFQAAFCGVTDWDAEVPDLRLPAEEEYAASLLGLQRRAGDVEVSSVDDELTLACVEQTIRGELAVLAARLPEYSVGGPLTDGPWTVFVVASTTRLADGEAAAAYLERAAAFADYLDGCVERLAEGRRQGRVPVSSLVSAGRAQVEGYLAGADDVVCAVAPPPGWSGAPEWHDRLATISRESVHPAMQRYGDMLADLAAEARGDDECGLVHLEGGREYYDGLVQAHTTASLSAEEIHRIGLAESERLAGEIGRLGAKLGYSSVTEVLAAARSVPAVDPQQAMAEARQAVRRAEQLAPTLFEPPLPVPCEVAAMDDGLGRAGTPPHYTAPSPEGSRAGTYWFNTRVAGAGSGWDLEATAYHEAVPGHHLQLARNAALSGLPRLRSHSPGMMAHVEGWALYAELLAGEVGLYSSVEQEVGALVTRAFRAARLVVDTGVHAFGWPRDKAMAYMVDHVAFPDAFLNAEINRYIVNPAQALAYGVGMAEILRLREQAQRRLGAGFSLSGFHGAILDQGSLPLPALQATVSRWADGAAAST
jgi:uncharacterized protein (DUF885 family)